MCGMTTVLRPEREVLMTFIPAIRRFFGAPLSDCEMFEGSPVSSKQDVFTQVFFS